MQNSRLRLIGSALSRVFPERHIYIRSGSETHGVVLSTRRQVAYAALVGTLGLWTGICTAAMVVNSLSLDQGDQEVVRTQAKYERWIADRNARLNSAVAQLNATNGSIGDLAASVERRHAALATLMMDFKGVPGAQRVLAPMKPQLLALSSPMQRVESVRNDQERLVIAAESFAKSRAERLRVAMRLAGLNPGSTPPASGGLGGPLIEAGDLRALGAILDVDENFARRIQRAASDLSDMRGLTQTVSRLPFHRPTTAVAQSSSYGVRIDPFTRRPAFHSGLDFPGAFSTPIAATAPGIVSFTGQRSGYGRTIEIDHGGGFKTRYAHLQGISVTVGERVAVGERIGAMGSSGRSTGPHLHYEVWSSGRAQNPNRFLRAGEYVQQTN